MLSVSRREWGARHGLGSLDPGPEDMVVFHHSWKPHLDAGCTTAAEAEAVRGIERFHAVDRGWAGIGYNWLIFQSGHIYEGRGWEYAGAHTVGQNQASIGVCFVMNGDEHDLSPAAKEAATWLLAQGIRGGHLASGFAIHGHRDFSPKTCPGTRVTDAVLEGLRP